MDINKEAMAVALKLRADPFYERELFGYLRQMAIYFANKFNISPEFREEYILEAYVCATKALDKYDPEKNKSPFSYFYKTLKTHFMYWMRYDANKRKKGIKNCSFELVENTINEDGEEFDESCMENDAYCSDDALLETSYEDSSDKRIMIYDEIFKQCDVISAIKEAKLLSKKKVSIADVDNHLVCICLKEIYEHKEKKMKKEARKNECSNQ